jgi:ribosome biogenesis GTPase
VHSLGIEPVLVVNKAELLAGSAALREAPFSRLDPYRDLGYTVVQTSCKGAPGVDALLPLLHDATGILVGQSGVGKSALVNRLIPDLELQTGELSATTGKGTHTTTTTMLYTLPGGGALIDSPGVWEYGLWKMSTTEIAAGFREFDTLSGRCRFNDCRHAGEPGCAVAEAAAAGRIHAWRLESYRRLLAQS